MAPIIYACNISTETHAHDITTKLRLNPLSKQKVLELVDKQCPSVDYRSSTLVADAAGAISRGFMKAFNYNEGGFTRVVC